MGNYLWRSVGVSYIKEKKGRKAVSSLRLCLLYNSIPHTVTVTTINRPTSQPANLMFRPNSHFHTFTRTPMSARYERGRSREIHEIKQKRKKIIKRGKREEVTDQLASYEDSWQGEGQGKKVKKREGKKE
ncbi:hypothetical protein HL42_4337 [Trichophyton rubrum]|nr:hypothetical protein HL42_4337 [Trichophyton rubrum]